MSLESVQEVFRDVFKAPELVLAPEMSARDVENWDSLHHINLVVALEDTFAVSFSTDEIAEMENVGDVITLLAQKGVEVSW